MTIIQKASAKDQTVDLLQQILRTWLQPTLPPVQFDKMMRDSEWARQQPNAVEVFSMFEIDPIKKQMILSCSFTFTDKSRPKGLVLPHSVGKQ